MIHGILNVYKEKGYTSHDVVAKLRGIVGQKKIGHTGTLDPDAVGVLPVCLGRATKVCDLLTDKDKVYEAVLLLGKETDTQDTSGEVLVSKDTDYLTEDVVREAIFSFVGDYEQIPPMPRDTRRDSRAERSSLLPLEMDACLPGCVWNATPRSLSPLERNIGSSSSLSILSTGFRKSDSRYNLIQSSMVMVTNHSQRSFLWNTQGTSSVRASRFDCAIASYRFSRSTRLHSMWIPGKPNTSASPNTPQYC